MPMGIGPGLSVTRFESGIPGWMTGMDLGWDFTQNVQYSGATNPTDTHSATIYAQSAAGVWSPFAANTLVQTDLGLQTVPTRVELATDNVSLVNGWSFVGTTFAASATSPEANNANAVTVTQGSGASDGITFGRSIALAGASNHIVSPWFRFTGSARWIRVNITDNVASTFRCWVDLQNGAMGSSSATGTATLVSATLQAGRDGWYRLLLVGTVPSGSGSTSFGCTVIAVTADNGTTRQAGTYGLYCLNIQAGSFAVPPVINTSSASATVNGNQQVVDLTGRLGSGVGVIAQFNVFDNASSFKVPLSFNDGTGSNIALLYVNTGGVNSAWVGYIGGAFQFSVNLGTMPKGLVTVALVVSENYATGRIIGNTVATVDATVLYPPSTRLSIGGVGYGANDNNYQQMRRMALKFGAQNAATFADLVAKATILAAVS